ncbi:hypothetical protein ACLB2K_013696 [Fragaria x ananassa]
MMTVTKIRAEIFSTSLSCIVDVEVPGFSRCHRASSSGSRCRRHHRGAVVVVVIEELPPPRRRRVAIVNTEVSKFR